MGEVGALVISPNAIALHNHLAILIHVRSIRFDYIAIPHKGTKSSGPSYCGCCSYDCSRRYGYDLFGGLDEPDDGMPQTIAGYHAHPEASGWPM